MTESSTLTIRIPDELRAELDALAKSEDRSRAHIVSKALEEYLVRARQDRERRISKRHKELQPAIQALEDFMEKHGSFADEYRTF